MGAPILITRRLPIQSSFIPARPTARTGTPASTREVCEALFEWKELPFARTEVTFGEKRYHPSIFQAAADMTKKEDVAALRPVQGDDPA